MDPFPFKGRVVGDGLAQQNFEQLGVGFGSDSAVQGNTAPFIAGRMRLRDFWFGGDFGMKFNGDDETTEFQTAIQECQDNVRYLHLPEGRTGASAELTVDETKPLLLRGAGKNATIIEHGANGLPLFKTTGTRSAVTTLTADASVGDSQLTVVSTSGLAKGQILILRDQENDFYGNAGHDAIAKPGEMVRVRTVDSSTTFSIYGHLCWDYTTTGAGSDIRLLNDEPGGSVVSDFGITTIAGMTSSATRGFRFEFCSNVTVARLELRDFVGDGMILRQVHGFGVTGLDYFDFLNDESGNALYGAEFSQGTCHGAMTNCSMDYGRHIQTVGEQGGADIIPQHIYFAHLRVAHTTAPAFDTHAGCRWITWDDCHAYQCAQGFGLRAMDATINNAEVIGGDAGVKASFGSDRLKINGGRFENCLVGLDFGDSDDIWVGADVFIKNAGDQALLYEAEEPAWAGHVTNFRMDDVKIEGNPSDAAMRFQYWHTNFRLGPNISIPDASSPQIVGSITAPSVAVAASLTVPQ